MLSYMETYHFKAIEFHAIARDAKVQLMPAWPSDQLPPPTSSLLAIASRRELLAAGGPSAVVVASTEAVRNAFTNEGSDEIKSFTPQLTLDLGIRISHVAFSSDESFLAISAEQGGGLAVYEVDSLLKGNTSTSFEISTAQVSVRALVPNPGTETAALFAVVNTNGQLAIADMKARQVSNTIKEGVSCVAWSSKGKQLIAGLGDGSAVQMTPTGEVVKQLAKPPDVEGNRHSKHGQLWRSIRLTCIVSAIYWLDNFTFLVVHTASDASDPTSTFHIVIADKSGNCEYQKLPEVVGTFGLERYPPSIFVQRLKDFPPNLKEVLILASTASEDVGLVTKSTKPLTSNADASQITDTFTTTTMTNDSRRAALPMADDMTNSSPIGMALDLSSKTLVRKPLPTDEMDESPTPLPALLVLNNMGVLAGWWFTYAESIKTGTSYPGLVNAGLSSVSQQAPVSNFETSNGSAFGSGIKPATTGFGFPAAPASTASVFGQTNTLVSSQPAFGAPSVLNSSKPAFGSPSSLGSSGPVFGASSAMGSGNSGNAVFGATSGIGSRSSPWGGAANQTGGSTFGKPSFGSTVASPWATAGSGNTNTSNTGSIFGQTSGSVPQNSVFGSPPPSNLGSANQPTSGSGFVSFANTGGFGSNVKGPSIFASQTPSNNFNTNTESDSTFGSPAASNKSNTLFGSGAGTFNLGSAWKNGQADKSISKIEPSNSSSLFGSDFGKILGDATERPQQARSEERDMEDDTVETVDPSLTAGRSASRESTTPVEAPAPAKFSTVPPVGSGLFGTQAQTKSSPAAVQNSAPALLFPSTSHINTSSPSGLPLPPDTISKTTFTPTTSSETSTDSALKPASDTVQPSPSPTDASANQPPSIASESTTTKTPIVTKSAKSNTPTTISGTADSPPNLIPPEKKLELPATAAPTSSVSPSPKLTSTPIKASKEVSKSPVSLEPHRKESVTTIEDVEDAEDEEEYEEGEFDEEDEEHEDAEDDDEHEDNEEEEDDGSVIDVAKEIGAGVNFNDSTKSSFGQQSSGLTEASWANVQVPRLQSSQSRKDILEKVHFPPAQPDNERSPSPERRQIPAFLRSEGSRSISAPSIPPKSKTTLPRGTKQGEDLNIVFEQKRRAERARLSHIAAQRQAQEEQSLDDDQDETIQQLLASNIEPSRVLEPFLAHQDYTAFISKTGVPGQIERIYRDINSMIDTIGLNSRSIQAFTMGHEEISNGSRELEDLRTAKTWALGEIGELSKLQQELEATLHDARLRQVPEKMGTLSGLQTQIKALVRQKKEINAIAISQFENAAEDEQYRNLELNSEQQAQRQALRIKWKEFQDRLCETESAISMLKAKLATITAGSRNGTATKVPTVEAVEKTIRKMTKMAEEKSGDVDLLEAQMRKLEMHPGTPSTSRQGSPFMTPQSSIYNQRTSLRSEPANGASPLRNTWTAPVNGMDRSVNFVTLDSVFGPPRPKRPDEYTAEDIQPFVRRAQRTRIVMGHLRDALVGKNGEKTVTVVQLVDPKSE